MAFVSFRFLAASFTIAFAWLAWGGFRSITKQLEGCKMTYMYPNFIPINLSSDNARNGYNLFLYKEGWENIDHEVSLQQLSGVPVLFIPGNAGSYKQVRSLASESHRQWESGRIQSDVPLHTSLSPELFQCSEEQCKYANHLDWFTVDFLEEYSALDSRILRDQTEIVTAAVNKILDLYKQAAKVRKHRFQEQRTRSYPENVIIVGHSMGGLAARAALFHPAYQEGSVRTIITLASPHRSPPAPLQLSGSLLYSDLNRKWRNGFARNGPLRDVIIVSISGGSHDTQVRTPPTRLDGLVPPSNGFSVSASAVPEVWQETDHQVIVWCNQLVVKLAKSLLLLVDPATGQQYKSPAVRREILAVHLQSRLPEALGWLPRQDLVASQQGLSKDKRATFEEHETSDSTASSKRGFEEDGVRDCLKGAQNMSKKSSEAKKNEVRGNLIIEKMDGRQRWFANKRESSGTFVMLTNLEPCSEFRVRTWKAAQSEDTGSAESFDRSSRKEQTRRTLVEEVKVLDEDASAIEVKGDFMNSSDSDLLVEGEEMTLHFAQVPLDEASRYGTTGWVLRLDGDDLQGVDWIAVEVAQEKDASKKPALLLAQLGRATSPVNFGPSFLLRGLFSAQSIVLPKGHSLWAEIKPPLPLSLLPLHPALESLQCDMHTSKHTGPTSEKSCSNLCFSPLLVAWDPSIEQERLWTDLQAAIVQTDGFSSGAEASQQKQAPLVLLSDPRCTYKLNIRPAYKTASFRYLATNAQCILSFAVAFVIFALAAQSNETVCALVKKLTSFQTQFLGSVIALVIACSAYRYSRLETAQVLVAVISYCLSLLLAFGLVSLLAATQSWCVSLATKCLVRRRKGSPVQVDSGVRRSLLAVFSVALCLVYHPGAALLIVSASQCLETALSAADQQSSDDRVNKESRKPTGASDLVKHEEASEVVNGTKRRSRFNNLQVDSPLRDQCTGPLQRQSARLLLTLLSFVVIAPSLVAVFMRTFKLLRMPTLVDSLLVIPQVIKAFVLSGRRRDRKGRRQESSVTVAYLVLGLVVCCSGVLGAPYGVQGSFASVAVLEVGEYILATFGQKPMAETSV